MASSVSPSIDQDDVVDDTIMTMPQVPQVATDGSELVYNIIQVRTDELDYVERNKWIDQLVAKFRFLYSSLLDYQSNQFPSLTLLLNPGSLDQQSVVNQIQILMDEQRLELKSFELMLFQFGVGPEMLYPPEAIEMTAGFGTVPSSATSTYTSRDVHIYHGDGYEHNTVNFESSWTSNSTGSFLPQVMSTSGANFFPDSYSQLLSSNYCCIEGNQEVVMNGTLGSSRSDTFDTSSGGKNGEEISVQQSPHQSSN